MKHPYEPEYLPGATPLDPDEIGGLIPQYISTQGELNALEQENILQAEKWLARRRRPEEVLTETFLRRLHREMFGDVWRWAGAYRTTDKSIGVPWAQVPVAVKTFLENVAHQIATKTYSPDELGARFHHRLVQIHPFANGNGRHSRYMTDALLLALGEPPFTWGSGVHPKGIDRTGKLREHYIACLKRADAREIGPLMNFVRT